MTEKRPEILPGVRHYGTSGFATTWETYDALSEDDGWTEGTRDGVTVFAPHEPRTGANDA